MSRSITIGIPADAADKLAELARRQYRAPRQQAAVLLVDAIERAMKATGAAASVEQQKPVAR